MAGLLFSYGSMRAYELKSHHSMMTEAERELVSPTLLDNTPKLSSGKLVLCNPTLCGRCEFEGKSDGVHATTQDQPIHTQ
jgi:hypothetical protein